MYSTLQHDKLISGWAGGEAAERARREMYEAFEASCTRRIAAAVHGTQEAGVASPIQKSQQPENSYRASAYFDCASGLPVMHAIGPIAPGDMTMHMHKQIHAHYSPSAVSPMARPPAPKTPHSSHGYLSRGSVATTGSLDEHHTALATSRTWSTTAAGNSASPRHVHGTGHPSTASSTTAARDKRPALAPAPITPRVSKDVAMHCSASTAPSLSPSASPKSPRNPVVHRVLPHVCTTPGYGPDTDVNAFDAKGVSFPCGYKVAPLKSCSFLYQSCNFPQYPLCIRAGM